MNEPEDRRHSFTISVILQGHGANWSSVLAPVTVRAYDLPAALSIAATLPLSDWFPEDQIRTEVTAELRARMEAYGMDADTLATLFAPEEP